MEKKWNKIIELAEENGFLVDAYGGVALLATPEEQDKAGVINACERKSKEAKNGK